MSDVAKILYEQFFLRELLSQVLCNGARIKLNSPSTQFGPSL